MMPELKDFPDNAAYIKWHSDTKHVAFDQLFIDMMIRTKGENWVAIAIEEKMDRENDQETAKSTEETTTVSS